ncbi:AAA family ATPase [Pseudobowmanella zhangzhouensis]|uniref:AAA family ATPase n=1 Tax=Pseudobowmanella zhangzhouensis TaxID=1537679 RepID=UPI00361E3AE3
MKKIGNLATEPGGLARGCHPYLFTKRGGSPLSAQEKADIKVKLDAQKAIREAAQAKAQKDAADSARQLFESLPSPINTDALPYLVKKGVGAYGIRVDAKGNIVMPLHDFDGNLCSLEFIAPSGQKWVHTDGQVKGAYHLIGRIDHTTRLVYAAEGYSTAASVHEATRVPVMVCRNANNLYEIVKGMLPKLTATGIALVVAADNDHEKEAQGKKNAGIEVAKRILDDFNVPYFAPPVEAGVTDFNDLRDHNRIRKALNFTDGHFDPYPSLEVTQFEYDKPPVKPSWLIKGVLPFERIGLIFGAPGDFKSFVTLDMLCHMANGMDWHGHRVSRPIRTLYVCGEGQSGVHKRLRAWCKHHGRKGTTIYTTNEPVPFLDLQAINALMDKAIASMDEAPEVIVLDTLNRNFGDGDENSTSDMTRFIDNLKYVYSKYNCMVIPVHHSGNSESDRARGSSALKGAVDVEFKVFVENKAEMERDPTLQPVIKVVNTKMKDGEPMQPMLFHRQVVTVGEDEDGDPQTSVVLVPSEPVKSKDWIAEINKGKTMEAQILIAFDNLLAQQFAASRFCPPIVESTELNNLLYRFNPEANENTLRKNINRSIGKLTAENVIKKMGRNRHTKYQIINNDVVVWLRRHNTKKDNKE